VLLPPRTLPIEYATAYVCVFYTVQVGLKFTSKSGIRILSVATGCMVTATATYRHHLACTTSSVQRGDRSAPCESR